MRTFAIALTTAVSALAVSAASAAPLSPMVPSTPENNIQNVRMVCNENGRCWHERSDRRVIIREGRDSYDYVPRDRYYERRGYRDRGVEFNAPGVSVGVGPDRY